MEIGPEHSSHLEGQDIEAKIRELISKMTLKQKLGQLQQFSYSQKQLDAATTTKIANGQIGSFLNLYDVNVSNQIQKISMTQSRLKIPLLIGKDIIHGSRTIFPIPLGQAATFNPDLVEQAARVAAVEGTAIGVRWTFSPMLDIARDPRWGRIAEGCGEDPYLTSKMGAAMIKGYQTNSLTDLTTLAACAKHYIGYGQSEGGRDYNTTNIPENLLRDIYLPPFKEAVKNGCLTFMSAFNCLNGVPASGNAFTIKQVLKKQLQFNGLVVSDWCSIQQMINHGYCQNEKEAARKGFNAGVDMEMVTECYFNNLEALINEGKVSLSDLEASVANILRVKFKMGLFENYYTDPARQSELLTEKNKATAKSVALQSPILLKNNKLPLNKSNIKTLAVIGPLADDAENQIGCWAGDARAADCITPLTSLKQAMTTTTIKYAKGLPNPRSTDTSMFQEAITAASASEIILAVMGEDNLLSGEANCRTDLGLPGAQFDLLTQLSKLGKPMILVVYAGRSLVLTNIIPLVDSLLYTFHLGTMAGPAIADLLLGVQSPSGRLPISFMKHQGQIPVYYNKFNTGRPDLQKYIEVDSEPLFPFGYGLTYSRFSYSNIKLSLETVSFNEALMISATVKNQGAVAADEVALLFVKDHFGSYSRPVKELKGFKRMTLKSGESTTAMFLLNSNDLAFWTADNKWTAEGGKFSVWIGPNSQEGVTASFTLKD